MFSLQLGEGLSLRLLHPSDADALYALADRSREHLRTWMPDVASTTQEETRSYLQRATERWAKDTGFFCGICVDGALVGALGAHHDAANRAGSVGYWLGAGHEGRGLVTRSVRAVVDHYFRDRSLERMELRVQPGNVRSRAVAERCGFVHEGTLRQSAWVHDRLADFCVYGLLRAEWAAMERGDRAGTAA